MTAPITVTRPGVEALELGGRGTVEALDQENAGHAVVSRLAVTARAESALLRAVTARRVVRPVSGFTPDEASTQNERWAEYVRHV